MFVFSTAKHTLSRLCYLPRIYLGGHPAGNDFQNFYAKQDEQLVHRSRKFGAIVSVGKPTIHYGFLSVKADNETFLTLLGFGHIQQLFEPSAGIEATWQPPAGERDS